MNFNTKIINTSQRSAHNKNRLRSTIRDDWIIGNRACKRK